MCHSSVSKAMSLCFLSTASKNDKTENKTGEAKKPKTTGNKLRENMVSEGKKVQ